MQQVLPTQWLSVYCNKRPPAACLSTSSSQSIGRSPLRRPGLNSLHVHFSLCFVQSRGFMCAGATGMQPVAVPSSVKPYHAPVHVLQDQEEMKLALLLNVVDPNIGGVLIMGDRGTAKSVAVSVADYRSNPSELAGVRAVGLLYVA